MPAAPTPVERPRRARRLLEPAEPAEPVEPAFHTPGSAAERSRAIRECAEPGETGSAQLAGELFRRRRTIAAMPPPMASRLMLAGSGTGVVVCDTSWPKRMLSMP